MHNHRGHDNLERWKALSRLRGGGAGIDVVVSIHDLAPSLLREVRWLLAQLDRIGARPRVLKVVPLENGEHDLRCAPALVQLLQQEAAAGSEIVLHGCTHLAAGPLQGPWDLRLRGRLFAGPAAEFLSLDREAMAARVAMGSAILADVGLRVQGFCAPAWLAPPALSSVLRQQGFRYLAGMASVRDLHSSRLLRLPWLGYMGAGRVQERLIGLGGRIGLLLAARAPAVKVFLHPQGARDSEPCRKTLDTLAALLKERRPVTYAELLAP